MNPPALLPLDDAQARHAAESIGRLRRALQGVLFGQNDLIDLVIVGVLARGHVLLEGLPGLGKTELVKGLARALDLKHKRVQFTPDLLPGDITGNPVLEEVDGRRAFTFQPGPVFANILLADEINRASPKTQSALLEAMQERCVTVMGQTHALPNPFLVLATQNPIELEGTYPLPEAQLDRFAMKLEIGYPHRDDERAMLAAAVVDAAGARHDDGGPILEAGQLAAMQATVAAIPVTQPVQEYLVTLAASTRNHRDIPLGVSPRGLLTWQRAAQAWAYLAGRQFVTPDDVQQVAVPVLSVRLGTERGDTESLIRQLLQGVEAPTWS